MPPVNPPSSSPSSSRSKDFSLFILSPRVMVPPDRNKECHSLQPLNTPDMPNRQAGWPRWSGRAHARRQQLRLFVDKMQGGAPENGPAQHLDNVGVEMRPGAGGEQVERLLRRQRLAVGTS